MSITKTLMLAGFAVMSLGAGSAMADGGGATSDYWAEQYRVQAAKAAVNAARTPTPNPSRVQSGSSDIESPVFHFDSNLTEGGGG